MIPMKFDILLLTYVLKRLGVHHSFWYEMGGLRVVRVNQRWIIQTSQTCFIAIHLLIFTCLKSVLFRQLFDVYFILLFFYTYTFLLQNFKNVFFADFSTSCQLVFRSKVIPTLLLHILSSKYIKNILVSFLNKFQGFVYYNLYFNFMYSYIQLLKLKFKFKENFQYFRN